MKIKGYNNTTKRTQDSRLRRTSAIKTIEIRRALERLLPKQ